MKSRYEIGKKGATADNIFLIVTFFALALFFIAVTMFWNAVSTEADDLWTGSSVGNEIKADGQAAVNQFDWILLFVYFALHIGILVTAFLLRTHPVVFVAAILLTAILAMVAVPLSNAYADMTSDSDLSAAANSLSKSNWVMGNLPKFEVIWAFITIIVMFGLARMEGYF